MGHQVSMTPSPCLLCGRDSLVLWAANPPESGKVLCPYCFKDVLISQRFVEYPYYLYFTPLHSLSGAWHPRQDVDFRFICNFVESCIKDEGPVPSNLRTKHIPTIEQILFQLYDYIVDASSIPHWRNWIRNLESILTDNKCTFRASALARLEFYKWRLYVTSLSTNNELGIRQTWEMHNLRNRYECWLNNRPFHELPIPVIDVQWELLAPSGDGWQSILAYYNSLHQMSESRREDNRLKALYSFKPDVIFCGRSKFSGYLVFVFDIAKKAILESAYVGNALYVMESEDWRELSKLSKTELLDSGNAKVKRIIHPPYGWGRQLKGLMRGYGINVDE